MKKLFLLLAFCLPCLPAQTLSLGSCPTSVKVGTAASPSTISCTVTIANGQGPSGFQYTVTTTPSLGTPTVTPTGSAAGALKDAFVSGNVIIQGGFGPPAPGTLNAGLIPDGAIATLTWAVPASLANTNVTITLAGGALPAEATSPTGSAIPVTVGPAVSVSVLPSTNFCDVNGDGQVNQADVTAQIAYVMTFPQSTKCARDGTGCNVTSVQLVVNAALGGVPACTQ